MAVRLQETVGNTANTWHFRNGNPGAPAGTRAFQVQSYMKTANFIDAPLCFQIVGSMRHSVLIFKRALCSN